MNVCSAKNGDLEMLRSRFEAGSITLVHHAVVLPGQSLSQVDSFQLPSFTGILAPLTLSPYLEHTQGIWSSILLGSIIKSQANAENVVENRK